jgi:hypothetical protein
MLFGHPVAVMQDDMLVEPLADDARLGLVVFVDVTDILNHIAGKGGPTDAHAKFRQISPCAAGQTAEPLIADRRAWPFVRFAARSTRPALVKATGPFCSH